MNFDIDQLRAFEAVMRMRNFRAAARTLGVAQSSVSLQVARLEARLGHRLFTRTTRRVEPTPEGHALLTYAKGIMALAEEARRRFERPARAGVLRLGIVEDVAQGELHLVLGLFRRQFPCFGLTLTTGVTGRLLRGLDAGEIDVALTERPPGRGQGRLLYERPLVWCGDPAALPGDADAPVPIVASVEQSGTRAALVAALRGAGRAFTFQAESDGLAGVRAAVAAGFGVTAFCEGFVPHGIARLSPGHGLPALGSVAYVIDRHANRPTDAVDAFVALLCAPEGIVRPSAGGSIGACLTEEASRTAGARSARTGAS